MQTQLSYYDDFITQGTFGRHETFTPRYGWLKKGYDAIVRNDRVFLEKNAIEELGVGKNMVSAIKYWCSAFNLISPDLQNKSKLITTVFGDKLLDDNGWDPYLEDPASLWLLHWQLFIPPLMSISWNFAFSKCNLWSFDIKQLMMIIMNATKMHAKFASLSENTYLKDASCIIRMYTDEIEDKDDEIDTPFTELNLLNRTVDSGEVSFNTNFKQNLPPLIFAAACFDYLDNYSSGQQRTISLQRLTYDFNSPGIAFKVPETVAGFYLANASKKLAGFTLRDDISGYQLYCEEKPKTMFWEALETYYKESNN